jgi:serine/threonine-protein kinase
MVLRLFRRDRIYKPLERIGRYSVEKLIGEGRFGICYQVTYGQKPYILKQIKRGAQKKTGAKIRFEEDILKSMEHEAFPRFVEKIEMDNFVGYILEYKEGKTFEDILYLDKHVFSRDEIYRIGSTLIELLTYLQSKRVVHRDIRGPNLLYDGQKIFLIDFGLARWIDDKQYKADMDFAFLGDFLLHLYYSSFEYKGGKKTPWFEELELSEKELVFLKRLMGIEQRYSSIAEVEYGFRESLGDYREKADD